MFFHFLSSKMFSICKLKFQKRKKKTLQQTKEEHLQQPPHLRQSDGLVQAASVQFSRSVVCREPVRGTPFMAKVMRKEARHTQRRDRASGVPLDILEHLPPKNQGLPTLLLCALTSDFTGGCPPPPSPSL